MGGSYPGALSAWFKSKYPNHVVAAWSSSAVINAVLEFPEFDESIYTSTHISESACPRAISDITKFVENIVKK